MMPADSYGFGESSSPIWLDGVRCRSERGALWDCCHNEWGVHDCTHAQDVGVKCFPQGELAVQ